MMSALLTVGGSKNVPWRFRPRGTSRGEESRVQSRNSCCITKLDPVGRSLGSSHGIPAAGCWHTAQEIWLYCQFNIPCCTTSKSDAVGRRDLSPVTEFLWRKRTQLFKFPGHATLCLVHDSVVVHFIWYEIWRCCTDLVEVTNTLHYATQKAARPNQEPNYWFRG